MNKYLLLTSYCGINKVIPFKFRFIVKITAVYNKYTFHILLYQIPVRIWGGHGDSQCGSDLYHFKDYQRCNGPAEQKIRMVGNDNEEKRIWEEKRN